MSTDPSEIEDLTGLEGRQRRQQSQEQQEEEEAQSGDIDEAVGGFFDAADDATQTDVEETTGGAIDAGTRDVEESGAMDRPPEQRGVARDPTADVIEGEVQRQQDEAAEMVDDASADLEPARGRGLAAEAGQTQVDAAEDFRQRTAAAEQAEGQVQSQLETTAASRARPGSQLARTSGLTTAAAMRAARAPRVDFGPGSVRRTGPEEFAVVDEEIEEVTREFAAQLFEERFPGIDFTAADVRVAENGRITLTESGEAKVEREREELLEIREQEQFLQSRQATEETFEESIAGEFAGVDSEDIEGDVGVMQVVRPDLTAESERIQFAPVVSDEVSRLLNLDVEDLTRQSEVRVRGNQETRADPIQITTTGFSPDLEPIGRRVDSELEALAAGIVQTGQVVSDPLFEVTIGSVGAPTLRTTDFLSPFPIATGQLIGGDPVIRGERGNIEEFATTGQGLEAFAPDEEESQAERFTEGVIQSPFQLASTAPAVASVGLDVAAATPDVVEEIREDPIAGTREAGEDVAEATQARVEQTAAFARENPFLFAGQTAGSFALSGAAFAGARAAGGTVGRRALGLAIQPGEEIAGILGARALPAPLSTRLFPRGEPLIFSEEAAIAGARRAGRGAQRVGQRFSPRTALELDFDDLTDVGRRRARFGGEEATDLDRGIVTRIRRRPDVQAAEFRARGALEELRERADDILFGEDRGQAQLVPRTEVETEAEVESDDILSEAQQTEVEVGRSGLEVERGETTRRAEMAVADLDADREGALRRLQTAQREEVFVRPEQRVGVELDRELLGEIESELEREAELERAREVETAAELELEREAEAEVELELEQELERELELELELESETEGEVERLDLELLGGEVEPDRRPVDVGDVFRVERPGDPDAVIEALDEELDLEVLD